MREMRLLYVFVFDAVGSRAPWRERIWAKVTVHVAGIAASISEGTEKKGLYWPHECVILVSHWYPFSGVSHGRGTHVVALLE